VRLSHLPEKRLEETNDAERQIVAELIAEVASLPGIKASLATKTLHKKRPALIPVLDNRAIFGAYMNPGWPHRPPDRAPVGHLVRIKRALDCIATDLTREENICSWHQLQQIAPNHSWIEIFDMVWWMYFREVEERRS